MWFGVARSTSSIWSLLGEFVHIVVKLRVVWIVGSTSDPSWVFHSLRKIYIFICIGLIKIYILFMKPNQPYDELYALR
jgi:hypothetical protein